MQHIRLLSALLALTAMFSVSAAFAAPSSAPLPKTAPAMTYTLDQAVLRGLEANPSVEAKQLIMEQAEMSVKAAWGLFSPTVSATYSDRRLKNEGGYGSTDDLTSKNWSQGIRVSYNLFNGFAHLNNLEKSQISVDVEKARHRQARLELGANIQLEFLQLLKAREDLKTVSESRKRITAQLDSAKAFVAVGMAPYLNVLQNEVELSRVEQDSIRVKNAIRTHEVQLNKYLGFDPNASITYVGNLQLYSGVVGYTENEAIKTAIASRPDLAIAERSVAVAIKQSNITLAQYLPRASLDYEDMHSKKDYEDEKLKDYTRDYSSLSLNLVWEFFSGGTTTFTYLGDRKRIEAMRKDLENSVSQSITDVIKALLDIRAASELINVSRKALDAANESYAIADKRYVTHTGTITDLLDAQLKLTRAEADASQALTEFHSARAKFFYNIGRENPGLD